MTISNTVWEWAKNGAFVGASLSQMVYIILRLLAVIKDPPFLPSLSVYQCLISLMILYSLKIMKDKSFPYGVYALLGTYLFNKQFGYFFMPARLCGLAQIIISAPFFLLTEAALLGAFIGLFIGLIVKGRSNRDRSFLEI